MNYYSLCVITDPESFDSSFYGAGSPESYFTEHYATYDKLIKAVKLFAGMFPGARLQANVRIPEGLIDDARNPAPEADPVDPVESYTGPTPTFEELFSI